MDIPQLQRVIVAYEDKIAMHRTMDASLEAIFNPDIPVVDTEARAPEPEEVVADTVATEEPAPMTPTVADTTLTAGELDREQVRTLWDQAQRQLRNGDWEGFGQTMDQLKREIEQ